MPQHCVAAAYGVGASAKGEIYNYFYKSGSVKGVKVADKLAWGQQIVSVGAADRFSVLSTSVQTPAWRTTLTDTRQKAVSNGKGMKDAKLHELFGFLLRTHAQLDIVNSIWFTKWPT